MRHPAVAGRFYPQDPDDLEECIEWCFSHELGPGIPRGCSGERNIASVVVPHAGYVCSGMVAAHAFKELSEDGHPDAYVIIGPDHHGVCPGSILCSEGYATPLGICPTHTEICRRLSCMITDEPRAHTYEHSVEVEVPFIQYIDPDAHIVPILMGDQSIGSAERLAECLRRACDGFDVVVVASTDLSHYIPRDLASHLDGLVLDRICSLDVPGMYRTVRDNRVSMCGYGPTAVAMMMSGCCEASVLCHLDSFDSLGMDPDSVVDYASVTFTKRP